MKLTSKHSQLIQSEAGIITFDFLFASVLVGGFFAIMFSLSLTLTTAQVVQYITFSSARVFSASHFDVDNQRSLAAEKYIQLTTDPNSAFSALVGPQSRWFSIDPTPFIGRISDEIPAYKSNREDAEDLFIGAGTTFFARILDFNIPFYGSTTDEGDGEGSGFRTFIASYLGRDPSHSECRAFNIQRATAIKQNLDARWSSQFDETNYVLIMDNGC